MRKEPTVAYYYDPKQQRLIVVMHNEQWAARNLRAKGILSMQHLFTRAMTPDEVEGMEDARRLYFYSYFDWETVFSDEARFNVPAQHVEQVKKFAEAHPLRGTLGERESV